MRLTESIVEDAALRWFGESGYAIIQRPRMSLGEPVADGVFGLPPRISIPSSPNLELSSPNLTCSSPVLLANFYDSRKAVL